MEEWTTPHAATDVRLHEPAVNLCKTVREVTIQKERRAQWKWCDLNGEAERRVFVYVCV